MAVDGPAGLELTYLSFIPPSAGSEPATDLLDEIQEDDILE